MKAIKIIGMVLLCWIYIGGIVTTYYYAESRQAGKGDAAMAGIFWPIALPFIATADIVEEYFGREDPADKKPKPEAIK